MWEIIKGKPQTADENMADDQRLLSSLGYHPRPILHLYEWQSPSITYGYFAQLNTLINTVALKKYNIYCARRPTGGGAILHLTDLAFSILIPSSNELFSNRPIENYNLINNIVIEAIQMVSGEYGQLHNVDTNEKPTYCMKAPTKYDVVINGKKAAGAAQRKTKDGFLHQGSISIALPPQQILLELVGEKTAQDMLENTFHLTNNINKVDEIRLELKRALEYLIVKY